MELPLTARDDGGAAPRGSRLSGYLTQPPRLWWMVLVLPALLSLGVGIFQASHKSIDLQWSCARLVALHQDPWKVAAAGDPNHQILFGQVPGYLPELYLLLLPLGAMSFSAAKVGWLAISLALSLASLWMTIRMFRLTPVQAAICGSVFLASTPLRVALANGQQVTLELAFLAATFYCTGRAWKGIWLGLSYFKYSFSPVVLLSWLLDRRYTVLVFSLAAPVAGMVGVFYLTRSSSADLIWGPIVFSEKFFRGSYGFGDVMSFAKVLVDCSGTSNRFWFHFPEVLALFGAVGAALRMHRFRRIDEPARGALMMTWTLLLFRHLIYDFVLLLLPFAAALRSDKRWPRFAALAIVGYFWFGSSIVNRLIVWPSLPMLGANCFALSMLIWLTEWIFTHKTTIEANASQVVQPKP